MSVPQMLPTVEHSVPAIFEGGEDPEAVTALDVSIAPSARGKDEKKSKDGLARLRRDLRRSNETHDFAKGDEPAPTAEVPLTKSKGNGSFRSRRLSTEMVGESREKAEPPRDNSRPLEPVRDNTAEPSSKAGASSVLGLLRSTSPRVPRGDAASKGGAGGGAKPASSSSTSSKAPVRPALRAAPPSQSAGGLPKLLFAKEFEELGASPGAADWSMAHGIDSTTVALLSCHGAEPAKNALSLMKDKINQDCACVATGVGGHNGAALFCVYDGHGGCGRDVSQFAMREMCKQIESKSDLLKRRPAWALADAFGRVQDALRDAPAERVDASDAGACALVVYMRDDHLWVAGAGDTRAVLGTSSDGILASIALSTDHKASVPSETARIRACGGFVKPADPPAPARVHKSSKMTGPGLAISRCLGDCGASECGVIATPEVVTHILQPEDKFLILASDGVWEFLGSNEAVEIVDAVLSQGKSVGDACHHLVATAVEAWMEVEGDYRDDITACIVKLPPVAEALKTAAAK